MTKDIFIGLGAAFSANFIFGLNIPVTKALVAHWMTPMGYTGTRMIFGALAFWTIAFLWNREKMRGEDLLIVLIGGLLGYLGTQFAFAKSLEYTGPVIFSLLISLTPVATLLISAVVLREGISMGKCVGIVLSISGAFLVILEGRNGISWSNNILGIMFVLLCVILYSSYIVITRKVATRYSPVTIAKWMFFISALALLPMMPSEYPRQIIYSGAASTSSIGLLAFALIFSTILAFFCMPFALKKLEAGTVSIFMNMQPIVASGVAIGVGQDSFSLCKGLAAMLVLSGVYLVSVYQKSPAMKATLVSKGLKGI